VIYRLLADVTVVIHLVFVLFVVAGGWLVLRRPQLAWLHVPAALWGAFIELAGWMCPLTPLENWLREQGGRQAYTTSFVEHYLIPVLYPQSLTREVQWVLGGLVLVVNIAVYALIVRRTRRRK
jgi:hypothetical protein